MKETTGKVFSFRTEKKYIDMLDELKEEEEKRVGYKITYSQFISKIINLQYEKLIGNTEGKDNDTSK